MEPLFLRLGVESSYESYVGSFTSTFNVDTFYRGSKSLSDFLARIY